MSLTLLPTLRRACVRAARDETLAGCCASVALAVQYLCGGVLVEGLVEDMPHYWNRLPDGTEVDLTSTQFGGDGWNPPPGATMVEDVQKPELTPIEHLLFIEAVVEELR
jgi:hypothetical protein